MRDLLFAALLPLSAAAGPAAPAPRVVKITARKFAFEPSEIRLKKGEPVVLELTSLDRTHGFKIAELKLRVDVTTGAVVRVPLTPEKVGTFVFSCDVFCGLHHDDMSGTLVVEP